VVRSESITNSHSAGYVSGPALKERKDKDMSSLKKEEICFIVFKGKLCKIFGTLHVCRGRFCEPVQEIYKRIIEGDKGITK
jgi:hypothetical protein